MRLSAIAAVAALSIALPGCASVIKGTSQSIAITTPPTTGAECTLSSREGNWTLASPAVVSVQKSKEDMAVRCTKPGWQDAVATIPSDFQGWTIADLFIPGGLVGLGVDAATGAINEYPNAFQVPMQPIYGYAPPLSVPSAAPAMLSRYVPLANAAPPEAATTPDANGFQRLDQWKPSTDQPASSDTK